MTNPLPMNSIKHLESFQAAKNLGRIWERNFAWRPVYPRQRRTLAEMQYATEADVDRAVRNPHDGFLRWRDVPVVERIQPLSLQGIDGAARQRGRVHPDEARTAKTADDARMEVRRTIQMIEVAFGMPSLMMGDSLNDVAAGIDCKSIRQPMGVCAGITPFNFSSMVPLWIYPFAIACSNTRCMSTYRFASTFDENTPGSSVILAKRGELM